MGDHALSILVFFVGASLFAVGGLASGLILGRYRARTTPQKTATYECGNETQGPTWIRLKTNYFTYALVFLLFDVEIIFLFPWATKTAELGLWILLEIIVFVTVLVLGLWYACRKGALKWY